MRDFSNIKVIFIDIDGTLTDSNKNIPLKNILAIKKAVKSGILVVICSGRAQEYASKIALTAKTSQYLISNNGAQIFDFKENKTLYANKIPNSSVKKLLEGIKEYGIDAILNTTNGRFKTPNLLRKLDEKEKVLKSINDIEDEEILQIVCETKSYNAMTNLINEVKLDKELKILNLSRAYLENKKDQKSYYADINNNSTSKGSGIINFLNIFNIKKEDSLCFGDFINDIDMFKACGYKVAMKNASEELKEIADYVTLSNNEAGVGDFIEKFILK